MQHPNIYKIQYFCAHTEFLQAQKMYHHWTIIFQMRAVTLSSEGCLLADNTMELDRRIYNETLFSYHA